MIRKKDIFLIGALVLLAGGLLLLLPLLRSPVVESAAYYLRYSIDGKAAETVPLGGERDLTVTQEDGRVNVLHLLPQGFFMASSTCSNQLCVYQGEVTVENMAERPLYHMIVCAPHRLVAELLTEEQWKEQADGK